MDDLNRCLNSCISFVLLSFDWVVSRSMFHHADDPARAAAFDAIELLRDPSHRGVLTLEALRALGRERGLVEIAVSSGFTSLPLESVLATSFSPPGMLDHVRSLLARDAAAATDIFGLCAKRRGGAIWGSYPTMIVGWFISRWRVRAAHLSQAPNPPSIVCIDPVIIPP